MFGSKWAGHTAAAVTDLQAEKGKVLYTRFVETSYAQLETIVCVSVNFFLLHFRTVNVVTGRTGTTEVGTYLYVYFNNNNY